MKGFARAIGHYVRIIIKERKCSCNLTFTSLVESGFSYRYKITIAFPEAVESQGRVITSEHHLSHGDDGLASRINITPSEGSRI